MRQNLHKQKSNYTQVANCILNTNELSAKAKGLFTYIYGKPSNWDFSTDRIADEMKDGRDAVASGLKELEKEGYLQRKRRGDGRVEYWLRYDKDVPFESIETKSGKPSSGTQTTSGKSQSGKIHMLSNKENKVINSLDNSNELSKGERINEGIHWFESVNPSIDRVYGHDVQRDAMEWLLENYRAEKIYTFVTEALPELNGKQYFPTTTTPNQLVKNLSKIKAYFDKQEDKQSNKAII